MKSILIGLAAAGVALSIAIGARDEFPVIVETSETALHGDAQTRDDGQTGGRADGQIRDDGQTGGRADAQTTIDGQTGGRADGQKAEDKKANADTAISQSARPPVRQSASLPLRASARPRVGASEEDAAAILTRAAKAYQNVRTVKASFRQTLRNPLLGADVSSAGTLYQQRPDRIALKFTQPAGDVILSDGRFFWVFYPSVDAKQVIRAPAAAAGAGGVDLQAQFLGDPVRRFTSTVVGHESVGGRAATVLTMIPKTGAAYKQLKVWIDDKDSLARRFEITEETGSVRRFELSSLQVNATIPASTFVFTPPAGARIIDR